MKRYALLTAVLTLISVQASAQGFLDQSKSLLQETAKEKAMESAGIPTTATVPTVSGLKGAATSTVSSALPAGSLSLASIKQKLIEAGYSKITCIAPSTTGDTLKVKALNAAGVPTNLQINPLTGAIISAVTAK